MLHGGFISAAPVMAASFKWGMKLGDFWMGMPFLVAFGSFMVGSLLLLLVAFGGSASAEDDDESTTAIG